MIQRATIVPCTQCGADLWWGLVSSPPSDGAESIHVDINYPPRLAEQCPRCGSVVDTRASFPSVDGLPLSFDQLVKYYDSFVAEWHFHGAFPDERWSDFLKERGNTVETLVATLNTQDGMNSFRQGMFYRSSAAFYRSLQLLCAFVTLERRHFKTWAEVSGYYSRFFFLQAFLNLLGITWFRKALVFFDGTQVRRIPEQALHRLLQGHGSHEIWWQLMEALRRPEYPLENVDFVFSRAYFDPAQRNRVNYQFEYIWGGFNELSWFDSGPHQLVSHFMPRGRPDRDITNMERFFEGCDPESADVGDFMGDDAQILWCSLRLYLSLVKTLNIQQEFIRTDTVAALVELHLKNGAPRIMEGIVRSTGEIQRDDFDVQGFLDGMGDRVSSFWPIRRSQHDVGFEGICPQ